MWQCQGQAAMSACGSGSRSAGPTAGHRQGCDMVRDAAQLGAKWQRLGLKAAPVGMESALAEAPPAPLTGRALSQVTARRGQPVSALALSWP